MKDGAVGAEAVVCFGSAREAQRPVAGVPVVARILRELSLAGFTHASIEIASGEPLDAAALREIGRLAPALTVRSGATAAAVRFPGDRLIAAVSIPDFLARRPYRFTHLDTPGATAEILRGTGKAADGIVSRWLNRPVSRVLSALLLRVPGVRPIHATAGTAAIAAAMFLALVFGGHPGLIAGALLFHAASVFDGVDGEIARTTFRTSPSGAAMDSAVDLATNVAAMLGLAINLTLGGQPEAIALGTWGLALLLLGLAMIGRRSHRETGSVSFDGVKHRYEGRFTGPVASRLMALATLGTSRDFCALVYLVLVLAGIPIAGLYLFAVVTPVWLVFVAAALRSSRGDGRPAPEGVA